MVNCGGSGEVVMKKRNTTDLELQRILDIIVVGTHPRPNEPSYLSFGVGPFFQIIGDENLLEFDLLVTSLYSADRDIWYRVTRTRALGG